MARLFPFPPCCVQASAFVLLIFLSPAAPNLSAQNVGTLVATTRDPAASASSAPKYKPGEVLVRFRSGVSDAKQKRVHAALRAQVARAYPRLPGLQLVRITSGASVGEAIRQYRQNPEVLYAEPNYRRQIIGVPNDSAFGDLWGLNNTGQNGGTPDADIDAPEAWNFTTGSKDVVVGVIDSGIDYTHPDLAANVFNNPLDCNNNGIDDDGNGYVDDCHGIDTFNNDSDPMDDHYHGTHVSGTIGAVGNNGVGVVGVNWNVTILACKFIGADGFGYDDGAIACLNYMATMKDRGVNIVATNNSWGGGSLGQALLDAIKLQREKGILFIAAAGNDSSDNDALPAYPASYDAPNVISVAATDSNDQMAGFSDFGRHSVHLGAPGVEILSTVPESTHSVPSPAGQYATASGTSMATPHVTGVAALLKAQDPRRDWKAIKNLILAGGDNNSALSDTISQRRLNALGAMTCSGRVVLARLAPRVGEIYISAGESILLSALHINCSQPNGPVEVSVDAGAETLTLADDGQGADQAAGDGIYTAAPVWSVEQAGDHTLTFPNGEAITVHVLPSLQPYVYTTDIPFNYRSLHYEDWIDPGQFVDDETKFLSTTFPVSFGGVNFRGLYVSSNGLISFADPYVSAANTELPTPDTRFVIAPFWDDLAPRYPDRWFRMYYGELGTAPNREYVVEWMGAGHYGCDTGGVRFQVVFFEGKSDILFNYVRSSFATIYSCDEPIADGASATVGIQVGKGMATQFSFMQPSLSDNFAILWQTGQLAPSITQLSPFTALKGDPGFSLSVKGQNFFDGSSVRWNGTDRESAFVNATELTASIPSSDLGAAGTAQVTVFNPAPNGSGESAPTPFKVYLAYPVPTLSGTSPQTLLAGSTGATLTVVGSDFVSGSVVRWNGQDRPTMPISDTRATALISEGDLADGGTVPVTVFNPLPGGGVSNSMTVTIENPVPAIDGLQPSTAAAGDADFMLIVDGSNFVPSSTVLWNGQSRPTQYVSHAQLTASIKAADIATAGDIPVKVSNPSPAGGTSNAVPLTVYESYPKPSISSLSPSILKVFGYDHTEMDITGTGFVASSVVRWNGVERPTKFISATKLSVPIYDGDYEDGAWVAITVFTPSPGGGTSNSLTLTIENPVPISNELIPYAAVPGGPSFALFVLGTVRCNPDTEACVWIFDRSSKVRWNGADLPTEFISEDKLKATVPASDISTAGTAQITVFNPAPGGGTSNSLPFVVVPPPPNDNFAAATSISSLPFTDAVDTRTATTEPTEPLQLCSNVVDMSGQHVPWTFPNSVWYKFTPSRDLSVVATVAGSSYEPIVSVWQDVAGVLQPVTCGRLTFSGPNVVSPGVAKFQTSAGTHYFFFITSVTPWPAGTLAFNVTGTGGLARLSTGSLTFAERLVGTAGGTQSLQLENVGVSRLGISGIEISGANPSDFVQSNTCGTGVAEGASCTISVTFSPTARGSRAATLFINDDEGGSPHTVALTGTGIAPVASLSAGSLTFAGQLSTTTSSAQMVTLSNTGDAAMHVTGIAVTGSNAADFAQTNSCGSPLNPETECTIAVTFKPASAGDRSAVLNITDDAADSPHKVTLTGTGTDFMAGPQPGMPTSITVVAGGAATFNLQLASTGFSGNLALACGFQGPTPRGASCSVSPGSVTLDGGGPAPFAASVATTAHSIGAPRGPILPPSGTSPWVFHTAALLLALLVMLSTASVLGRRRTAFAVRRLPARWAFAGGLLLLVLLFAKCGGSGGTTPAPTPVQIGTPAGDYVLTITATTTSGSTTVMHTMTLNLKVT